MTLPRLIKFYRQLPNPQVVVDPDSWQAGDHEGVLKFRRQVRRWYNEATLCRLLDSTHAESRRAAVVALSLIGGMAANTALAARLTDRDRQVRQFASDALWTVWFRGDNDLQNRKLQAVLNQTNPRTALRGLDALLSETSDFAEAYNQRAVLYYRLGEYQKAIADCERVLRLNPHHFGAAAGMAQCYVRLKKPRAALRAFRNAYRINPNLDDVKEAIQSIEEVLGGDGT